MFGGQRGGAPGRRWRWVLPGLLALAVVAGTVVYVLRGRMLPPPEECRAATAAGEVVLDPEQAGNAATITAVARSRDMPERAVTIALATAMQESQLRNLGGGDRDSLGLFQQRPSQGWGTARQIQDPVYATDKFLDALAKIPGYSRLPLTEAAQQVQRSGFPQAYAKHETEASVLTGALTGRVPAALSCTLGGVAPVAAASSPGSDAEASGIRAVTSAVHREFEGTVAARPLSGGQALDLTGDQAVGGARRASWAVAQWAVARAAALHITSVVCDGRMWRSADSERGWQRLGAGSAPAPGTVRVGVAVGVATAG